MSPRDPFARLRLTLTVTLALTASVAGAAAAQSVPQPLETFQIWLDEAGHALLDAATGASVDERWLGPDSTADLRSAGRVLDPAIEALGPEVFVIASTINVRWSTVTASPTVHLDLMPYAFNAGEMRWAVNSVVEDAAVGVVEPVYLDNGPSRLRAGLQRALEVMQTTCDLPTFTPESAARLPEAVRRDVTDPELSPERTCRDVASAAGDLWLPNIVFVAALVEGGGRSVAIVAPLFVEGGRAWMGPYHVVPFE